jgi:uncharacterized protein (TIGR02145 family)
MLLKRAQQAGNEKRTDAIVSQEIRDFDGNLYHSINIGTQVWMLENLNTTHYNDGTEIPNIKKQIKWDNLETGACCDYGNEPENGKAYGKLYNWYAVNSGKLCPTGWHVPTRKEWKKFN